MKIRWWQWVWLDWLPRQPLQCVGLVESADEIPEKLPKNAAVVVGTMARPKWVAFDCPCKSGHRIMLNLDRARSPWWSLSKVDGPLSLSPSVNYYDGRRRCHYFVRNGKIDWSGDTFSER
ncbi:DUF6527 family protein [Bradyrhizobium sp. CCGUVB14]|uniref:DUF6527 family protein n=1 Tax=Bradyrhizobium sp. CCGUVB14 TaxID=2949628 RepID=UPI0020B39FE3|nr:DUF6527 family protein [Bradyrhizobium sp. CCGUVB14]MCP3446178.1 DUF6527 family protein [Bradyrhizobium sp. CCGUVB14]